MKRFFKISFLIVVLVSFLAAGCSSTKNGNCGCPNKKGLVGY